MSCEWPKKQVLCSPSERQLELKESRKEEENTASSFKLPPSNPAGTLEGFDAATTAQSLPASCSQTGQALCPHSPYWYKQFSEGSETAHLRLTLVWLQSTKKLWVHFILEEVCGSRAASPLETPEGGGVGKRGKGEESADLTPRAVLGGKALPLGHVFLGHLTSGLYRDF